ncbi:MAG: hypothetical protein ACYC25_07985 [Paludibacter sp.]
MAKHQGLFIFIDTRDSTKRIYADRDSFDDYIKGTLQFVIDNFSNTLTLSKCECKPLGDGILIYYVSLYENLRNDQGFEDVLRSSIKASFTCVNEYSKKMPGYSPSDTPASNKHRLGISMGSGYVYDFEYKDKEEKLFKDIGSLDLTYVFRLNKFASPEGVVVSNSLYDNYKSIFEEFGPFSQKRKFIDDAFEERVIYVSKDVAISDDEGDIRKAYRKFGKYSIESCKEAMRLEIKKGKRYFPYEAPPPLRFMLFKCNKNKIEEVFNIYPDRLEGAKMDTFDLHEDDIMEVQVDDKIVIKYPHLIYECYYKQQTVFFAYTHQYIENTATYIKETKERFYVNIHDDKIKDFFESFTLIPSSALAIPIFDNKKEVKWIVALDAVETRAFKTSFYNYLGGAIRSYFETELRKTLEGSDSLNLST